MKELINLFDSLASFSVYIKKKFYNKRRRDLCTASMSRAVWADVENGRDGCLTKQMTFNSYVIISEHLMLKLTLNLNGD